MGLVSDRRTIALARRMEALLLPARRPHRGAHRGHPRRDHRPGREPGADHAHHQRRGPGVTGRRGSERRRAAPTRSRRSTTAGSWRCTWGPTAPTARSRPCSTRPTTCAATTCGWCWWAAATASRRWWTRRGGGGCDNVDFVDPVPKREVPGWLARADACLLPYQDNELFAGALPNKAFDYLGAARPIVAAAPRGELTRMVERAACGVAVPPEDGAAMAGAIRALAADRPRRAPHGRERAALRPGALRPGGAGRPLRGAGGVDCRPIAPGLDRRAGGRARQARRRPGAGRPADAPARAGARGHRHLGAPRLARAGPVPPAPHRLRRPALHAPQVPHHGGRRGGHGRRAGGGGRRRADHRRRPRAAPPLAGRAAAAAERRSGGT